MDRRYRCWKTKKGEMEVSFVPRNPEVADMFTNSWVSQVLWQALDNIYSMITFVDVFCQILGSLKVVLASEKWLDSDSPVALVVHPS
jgi:hypothetical protein